jgi:TM2 domain-containing membrane protein YozV
MSEENTTETPAPAPAGKPAGAEKKIVAGILGILLGGLGIHKFILGYTKEGVIMLLCWIFGWLLLGLGPLIMGIIGLIEGIMYLTKSDEEFVATYINGKKGWF